MYVLDDRLIYFWHFGRYLPTAAHLRYFLMTLYTSPLSTTTTSEADQGRPSTSKATLDPSYLPKTPTLVILHDLSLYLEEDDSSKCVFF